jgi:23S rRNA pseudouridine2605 synthase
MRDQPPKDYRPSRPAGRSFDGAGARKPRPSGGKTSPQAPGSEAKSWSGAPVRSPPPHKPPPHKKAAGGDGRAAKPRREPSTDAGGEDGAASNRIAKVMARAGMCSRRDAEAWINEGRVALNGEVLTNPAINVSDSDAITVDGEPLAQRARTRLFLFHKPRGLVTTERDPEGRPTVFDYLRDNWPEGPRVVSIGRLDINTEGLLLLTNDGGLARVLELPSTGWVRRYRVRAKGETDQSVLDGLRRGVTIDGVDYAEIEATLDRTQGANSWLTMGLREGKNREIKRVLEHIGLEVNRLIRLSFGPFQLGEIAEGAIEEVRTRVLRDQLGPSLAEAAGVDFLSPLDAVAEAEAARPPKAPRRMQPAPKAGFEREGGVRRGPMRSREDQSRETRSREPRQREPQAPARSKPAPGPRKHISALRADDGAGQSGARKRIERGETADRSGRLVHVERLVSTSPENRQDKRQDKRQDPNQPATSRNGRRFAAERKERAGENNRPQRGAGRPPTRFAAGKSRSAEPRQKSGQDRDQPRSADRNQRPGGARKPSGFASGEARPGRPQTRAEFVVKPRRNGDGERTRPDDRKPNDRDHAPKRFDKGERFAKTFGAKAHGPNKTYGAAKAHGANRTYGAKSSSPKSAPFAGKPARGPRPDGARPRHAGASAGSRAADKRPGGGKTGGPPRPGRGRPRDNQ